MRRSVRVNSRQLGRSRLCGPNAFENNNATPSIAWQINDWISIGAGVQIQYAKATLRRVSARCLAWSHPACKARRGTGYAVGATAGVTLTPDSNDDDRRWLASGAQTKDRGCCGDQRRAASNQAIWLCTTSTHRIAARSIGLTRWLEPQECVDQRDVGRHRGSSSHARPGALHHEPPVNAEMTLAGWL